MRKREKEISKKVKFGKFIVKRGVMKSIPEANNSICKQHTSDLIQ